MGFALYTDQDLWADWLKNEDRNYTMGVGLQANGQFVTRLPNARLHFLLDRILGLEPPLEALTFHGLTLVGSGYTPDSLLAEDPVVGDRPYGSHLLLATRRLQVRGSMENEAVVTELYLGALGLGVAPWIQTEIHERNPSPTPMGWDHQISDGGEPTAAYRLAYERRLTGYRDRTVAKVVDVSAGGDVWAGYYTNASVGGTVRLGRFYSQFWEFNAAPLQGIAQAVPTRERPSGFEAFIFGGARERAVLYNALLYGQFRASDYTLAWSDTNHLITEFILGMQVRVPVCGWSVAATYSVSGRTSEIRGAYARTHIWGSAHVSLVRALGGPPTMRSGEAGGR